jgi:quinol monooxygenase YgiN
MDKFALLMRLQAKKGKEAEVEKFLCEAMPDIENETSTSTWYAMRANPGTYFIFDSFPDEASRQAHLSGRVARKLTEKSSQLFSQPPVIEKLDLMAIKMPEVVQY